MRKNQGKPKLSKALTMPTALSALVDVLEYGEDKYSDSAYDRTWTRYKSQEVMDSMLRHAAAIVAGEVVDPESGKPHASHMLFNAAVYTELMANAYYSSSDSSEQMSLVSSNEN